MPALMRGFGLNKTKRRRKTVNHKEEDDFSGTWIVYNDKSDFSKRFYGKNITGICPVTSANKCYIVIFLGTYDECINYEKESKND